MSNRTTMTILGVGVTAAAAAAVAVMVRTIMKKIAQTSSVAGLASDGAQLEDEAGEEE